MAQGSIGTSVAETTGNFQPLIQIPSASVACDAFNGKEFENGLGKAMTLFPSSPLHDCGRGYDQLFAFTNEIIKGVVDLVEELTGNEMVASVQAKLDDLLTDGKCLRLSETSDICVNLPTGFSDTCWDGASSAATSIQPLSITLLMFFTFMLY